MPGTKITSSATKLVKEPIADIKSGIKTALKPADSKGTGAVFVGAILSAPIGYLYAKGFGMLETKFPASLQGLPAKIIKFALPILPIYFVKRFNLPFGNLINGTLLGIFVMQIVMEIWGLVGPKKEMVTVEAEEVSANGYAEF